MSVTQGSRMYGDIMLNGQSNNDHVIAVPYVATFGANDELVLTQPLHLYADAGTGAVKVNLAANTLNNTGGGQISISDIWLICPNKFQRRLLSVQPEF